MRGKHTAIKAIPLLLEMCIGVELAKEESQTEYARNANWQRVRDRIEKGSSQGESAVEEKSEWATLKRVIPRDLFDEIVRFEELVATYSGLPPRFQGIGPCVSVWSIIAQELRHREQELIEMAKDWKESAK